MDLTGIDHVALSVNNIERSANWYVEVLGFARRFEGKWGGIPVFVGCGATAIALFPIESKAPGALSNAAGPRLLHLAFGTNAAGFLTAQQELKDRGIPFHFQDHEISHSIYFCDPDGHELEITTYDLRPA